MPFFNSSIPYETGPELSERSRKIPLLDIDDGFDSKTMTLVPGSLVVLYESTNRTTKEISIEDITPSVDSFSLSSGYMSLNNQVSISDVLQLVIRYKYTNN